MILYTAISTVLLTVYSVYCAFFVKHERREFYRRYCEGLQQPGGHTQSWVEVCCHRVIHADHRRFPLADDPPLYGAELHQLAGCGTLLLFHRFGHCFVGLLRSHGALLRDWNMEYLFVNL